ncbi:MAG TPA: sulfotransferase [Steroidobacteraceae bacterium]|nr:sulfotransferase [Steroidobacteraceae bacterium]
MGSSDRAPSDCDSAGSCASAAEPAARLCERAAALFHAQRPQAALALYRDALRVDPGFREAQRGVAFAYRALGDISGAEQATAQALESDPRDYELVHLRTSLRQQTPTSNHVTELERMLAQGVSGWRGAVHVGYALAKELEDLGEYERSFSYLKAAATLKRSRTRYDPGADIDMLDRIRSHFDRDTMLSHRGRGCDSTQPIFVFGLPRTGSTLVERILASHPDVQSFGELEDFALELVRLVAERRGGEALSRERLLEQCLSIDLAALGGAYVGRARERGASKRRFVDKLPLNSLNAGLIQLALPGARMVWVDRDPLDACYAMYKFLFSGGYPFSYDLAELARYYVAHRRLMEHWVAELRPGTLYRVRYEKLVTDQEGETRRLLAALGLEWNPACLAFHGNHSPSMTGSATQVRRPIYGSSVGAWRHYARQLAPLRQILVAGGAYPERE